ncbi:MAG: cob(I)yrinic acid a,c-diamide adenosyltransferase [Ignavibacteria bacterium]|jgi:cob(I)alamin adenosyltransferase
MNRLNKGYIQIYTGNGKGKTTAAIGQAVRAAGYGLKTLIIQFMKDFPYNEITALERLNDLIEIQQVCKDDWVFNKQPAPLEEKEKAKTVLETTLEKMKSGTYDLIILDEVCVSIYFGVIDKNNVTPFFENKPDNVELILTGRYCPEEFIEVADLVTEMKEVKHYYQKGVHARKGIES